MKDGFLSTKYSSIQFDLCPQQLLNDSNLQLLVDKYSSVVTVAKARNSVRQTGATDLKQINLVTAGATAVSHVKIRISGVLIYYVF